MKQLKKHELNFYTRYTAKVEKAKANRRKLIKAMPFIAIVLIAGAVFAYFQLQINMYSNMIADEKLVYTDEQNIAIANEADMLDEQSNLYKCEADALAIFKKIQSSYPVNGSEEINTIFSCAKNCSIDINSISINSASGIAEIIGSVESESDIPAFIRELKGTELFCNVSYEGYSSSGEKNEAQSYSFTAEMRRKAIFDDSEFDVFTEYDQFYYDYDEENDE